MGKTSIIKKKTRKALHFVDHDVKRSQIQKKRKIARGYDYLPEVNGQNMKSILRRVWFDFFLRFYLQFQVRIATDVLIVCCYQR